jgi:hypothetical protein
MVRWKVGGGGEVVYKYEACKDCKKRCEILNVSNHRQRPIAFPIMKHELHHSTGILLLNSSCSGVRNRHTV